MQQLSLAYPPTNSIEKKINFQENLKASFKFRLKTYIKYTGITLLKNNIKDTERSCLKLS